MTLEYQANAWESSVSLAVDTILSEGADPPSLEVLRVMARYPAIYDTNSVFLGNFDFLIRRALPDVKFLAVWNEAVEERVRGASVQNVNSLFVSILLPTQATETTRTMVRQLIGRADDSLRVKFVDPVAAPVSLTITATVSAIHDPGDVESQIRTLLLTNYGEGSTEASRGLAGMRNVDVQTLLKANVSALQDQQADFKADVALVSSILPENYRYLTSSSVTVTVTRGDAGTSLSGAF
jgi:hypothetical protein